MSPWLNLVRSDVPALLPLTRAEAKAHCRVDHDDEDDLIDALIKAAVDHLDGYRGVLGRCLIDQTWTAQAVAWPGRMVLPFPDCKNVVISYRDSTGEAETVPAASYETIQGAGRTQLHMLSAFDYPGLFNDTSVPVTVQFVAGYGVDPADIPSNIHQALRLLIAHWYDHRQSVVIGAAVNELPDGLDTLISQSRVGWV